MNVVKRDGRIVEFEPGKIRETVENCKLYLIDNSVEKITDQIIKRLKCYDSNTETCLLHINFIQKIVQQVLFEHYEFAAHDFYTINKDQE